MNLYEQTPVRRLELIIYNKAMDDVNTYVIKLLTDFNGLNHGSEDSGKFFKSLKVGKALGLDGIKPAMIKKITSCFTVLTCFINIQF